MKRSGRARSFDGTRIAWRISGREGGPTVVLSNGIGCDRVFFRYLIRDLAGPYRVIAWDYRGHGDSGLPKDRSLLTIDALIQDLRAVMDATKTDHAILAGFSLGVQLHFEFYARYPERVRALIALCGAYEHPVRTLKRIGPLVESVLPLARLLAHRYPRLTGAVWSAVLTNPLAFSMASLTGMLDAESMSREDFNRLRTHFAALDLDLFARMASYMNEHTAVSVLPRIKVPALVVAGDQDTFTPIAISRRMHARIPDAEWCLVPGGTHASLLEQPALIDGRVADFLDQHFPQEAADSSRSRKS